jgi:hypothetical protein
MITEAIIFGLGWLMSNARGGKTPSAPHRAPWPQEPQGPGTRPLTKQERRDVQAAIPGALFEPLPKSQKRQAAERAAATAYGEPSPLHDVTEFRKATRPGGKVIAPDMPKSDWREPSPPEGGWGTDESAMHRPKG